MLPTDPTPAAPAGPTVGERNANIAKDIIDELVEASTAPGQRKLLARLRDAVESLDHGCRRIAELAAALRRLREWDHLDTAADGPWAKKVIDDALAGGPAGDFKTSTIERKDQSMILRPLADRVVIRQVEAPDRTEGGIYLPDTAKEKPRKGEVVAVGPGGYMGEGRVVRPLSIKVGDTVFFSPYAGNTVTLPGLGTVIIMKEEDVLAVCELEGGESKGGV